MNKYSNPHASSPTVTAIQIRPFQTSDRPFIESMAAEITQDGTVFPFESIEGVLAYWHSPGAAVFVAETETETETTTQTQVLGTYTIKPVQPDRGAHIANAGYMVAESARGLGVGRRMGEHSIQTARTLGYRAMQFNFVVATNEAAVQLWKSLGFRIATTIPGAFRHPHQGFVDALIMVRTL